MPSFLAILRVKFDAADEVEANLIANEMNETLDKHVLEDDDTCDVTQVLPSSSDQIAPAEMVEQLRRSRDILILTRKMQCFDLARELDKTAWIYEHRDDDDFDLVNYDWGVFMTRTNELLGRTG